MAVRFDGKVALITGTAGGQGRAAAQLFASEGAHVVGCDVKVDENAETVELVKAAGGRMDAMAPVDLGDPDEARAWVEEAVAVGGGVDILYNNASAARFAPVADLPVEDWQFTIRNELDLVFYVSKFAWPHLVARGGGVIISTASVAALSATEVPIAAHAAAKAGVVALTRQMALEGAAAGIRCVSISPGAIASPGTAELLQNPDIRAHLEAQNMLKKIGEPEDVARVALFLASDDASFLTGCDYIVDAGFSNLK
jgi:NAD(P)-dependent dehydrogenase (short-subunit alcohol dehydrogenase family)